MRKHLPILLLCAAPFAAAGNVLLGGDDLSAWRFDPDHWTSEDGVLEAREGGGTAWSHRRYGDFILELEYNISPQGNSGVFIRTDSIRHWLNSGMELQVLDSAGAESVDKHMAGALYDVSAPSVNAAKPAGEWNQYVIKFVGNQLDVTLNGKVVQDLDLSRWTEPGLNPGGSKNKFKNAYADMPKSGHFGLQDHSDKVAFRNIRVKPLSEPEGDPAAPAPKTQDGWEILFDGGDLDQWRLDERAWVIEDGALQFLGRPDPIETKELFDDFELTLEFRPMAGERGAVEIHGGERHWRSRLRIALTGYGDKPAEAAGAMLGFAAPSQPATIREGEWNTARIQTAGSTLSVSINGLTVNQIDLNDWSEAGKNPDGSTNRSPSALKDLPTEGSIALDGNVAFRNVTIETP